MHIRREAPEDEARIDAVIEAAFARAEHRSGTEGAIVRGLRNAGTLTLSLVAEVDGRLVGHVGFSPVLIGGEDRRWLGLGPLSVLPDQQGRGIGSALVREGLDRIGAAGARGCVVLGDPRTYARFGFRPDPALRFAGAPPEYFMALRLAGAAPAGDVTYQPAFYE